MYSIVRGSTVVDPRGDLTCGGKFSLETLEPSNKIQILSLQSGLTSKQQCRTNDKHEQ